jgi:outer membrane receptor for ferrienterochelin and colicins
MADARASMNEGWTGARPAVRSARQVVAWTVGLAVGLAGPLCTPALAQGSPNDLTLDSLLNTRVSTASRYAQTIAEAPAAVTIISAADIARHGWRDLSDVFATVRGLYTTDDRNYPYLGVRGFSRPSDYNNRILLLIDGHRINDTMYGSATIGSDLAIDLAMLERIEIVRGPGSALYGTNAMLATVNLITRSARQSDKVRVAAGMANGGERRAAVRLAGYNETTRIAGTLAAFLGERDGNRFDFPEFSGTPTHGRTSRTDYEHRYQVLGSLSRGDLSLTSYTNWRDKGIPTGAYDVIFDDPRSHTIDVNQFVEAKYSTDAAASTQLTVRLSFDRYWYHGGYAYTTGLQRERVESNAWTAEAVVRRDLSSDNRLIAGFEYRDIPESKYESFLDNTQLFRRDGGFRVMSLFLQDEQRLFGGLRLLTGIRRDEYSATLGYTTPRLALLWAPRPATTLKLMYGEAFRAPSESESELFQVGYKPNMALRPERLHTIEADLHERLNDEWMAMVSAYSLDVTDLIDPIMDPVDSLIQPKNLGHVRSLGVEVELSGRLENGVSVYASAAAGRTRDVAADTRMSNSPEWSVKAGASRRLGAWTTAVDARLEAPRLSLAGTTGTTSTMVDAHLSWGPRTAPGKLHHELSLFVRNLLNSAMLVPGGVEHRQAFLPMAPRTLSLQVSLTR